jgi:hypothetical protein
MKKPVKSTHKGNWLRSKSIDPSLEGRAGWQSSFICTASSHCWESIVILTTTLTTALAIRGKQRQTEPLEKSGLNAYNNPQSTGWLEFVNCGS